jgi:SAM-dependent methyltransferase
MTNPSPDTSARVTAPADAFGFGRNWQRYVDTYLDPERKAIAAASLRDLIGEDLVGKDFVDIGAGSGLFSLCAHEAGAARVISIDVDPDSVAACRKLRETAGSPDNWEVLEGSILDPKVVADLPRGDVVYSWGVLHHTGDMWTAMRNAAHVVKPGGLFCIAIYNRSSGILLGSKFWWHFKRFYNRSPRLVQLALEYAYLALWTLHQFRRRRNPFRVAREHTEKRGMAMRTDLVDWFGGYPYEYATADEIVEFCESQCGMEVVRKLAKLPHQIGNNELVFRRVG